VLLGGIIPNDFVDHLIKTGLPFIIAGARLHDRHVNAVMADVMQGMRQSMDYLIASGRQHITLVNGPRATTTSQEKYDALRLNLALHDRPFDPRTVVESTFGAEDGHRQTLRLLDQFPDTDAILYADDTIAVGGLRALRKTGRTVPDDVAVVGFGNYDIASFTDPALTSVDFDLRHMGRIAAHRLAMLLDNSEHDAWLVRVPTNLVVRGSA
ncbi:MAG: substrate-binding domain-containing protein, partial [Anaerolineae bacterium]|nr:substrate-binding domain-containing protein [Anaerolineae bacterium]